MRFVLLLLLLFSCCCQVKRTAPRPELISPFSTQPGASTMPPKQTASVSSVPVVSAVENASAAVPAKPEASPLSEFFRALSELDRQRGPTVRIVWFGDSHTAADFLTGRVRALLQERFGNGGPGFVPFGLKHSRHEQVLTALDGKWRSEPPSPASAQRQLDGIFGLSGQRSVSLKTGVRARARIYGGKPQDTVRWQLVMRFIGRGSRVALRVGDRPEIVFDESSGQALPLGVLRTRGSQLYSFDIDAQTNEEVHLRVVGGAVELYGAVVERADPGLILDAAGLNGARAWTPLGWQRAAWLGEVSEREPRLVVLAYGTNEASDGVELSRYAAAYREILGDLRHAVEGVECLFVGPTARGDARGKERVVGIDAFQRELSRELGCAYFSLFDAMGRDFDTFRKAAPALAASDGVHLTRAGYERLGEAFTRWLLESYASR